MDTVDKYDYGDEEGKHDDWNMLEDPEDEGDAEGLEENNVR